MAGKRARKNSLIAALKAKALAYNLPADQVEMFERLYRGARTQTDQDQVTRVLDEHLNGWRTRSDAFSRVLQAASNIGELADDDDEDPPELKAHLERARVSLRR